MAVKKVETRAEIQAINIQRAQIKIVGDTPLIMHKWSKKAKQEMLDKQMKKTKTTAREAKDPVRDFIESMYWIDEEPTEYTQEAFEKAVESGASWGFPVTAVKQAAISAAYRSGMSKDKVSIQGTFFIEGIGTDLLGKLECDTPKIREDMVKIAGGTADIRYRGEFTNWSMILNISYNANGVYTFDQIVNMINLGGFSCGLGEWRTEKGGQFGMFHVEGI